MKVHPIIGSLFRSIKDAIAGDREVQGLVERHPRLFAFLKNRLRRDRFAGLTLTFLGGLFFYLLFLLIGTVEDVVTADTLVAADVRLDRLLASFRTPWLTRIFLLLTALGTWPIVISAAAALSAFLLLRKKSFVLPFLWLSLTGGAFLTFLGKLAFHRPRPLDPVYLERSWSFPSGHACEAVILWGFVLYLLWGELKTRKTRWFALLGGTALAMGIGFSRLYLGVHYLSDVWSGFLLGLLLLIAGIAALESFKDWREILPPQPPGLRGGRAVLLMVLLLAGVFFAGTWAWRFNPPLIPPPAPALAEGTAEGLDLFRDNRLPRRTETLTGSEQEPLSFILKARGETDLIAAMASAGWFLAESLRLLRLPHLARTALFDKGYPSAPMTPSFWNGWPHDLGFEKPVSGKGVRERHHARFWRTGYRTVDGRDIYVGTASLDVGIKWGVVHRIRPDIDTERDLLLADLNAAHVVEAARKEPLAGPTMGKNFFGDPFFTDGQAVIAGIAERKTVP